MMLQARQRFQGQLFNLGSAVKLVWQSSRGWAIANLGLAVWQGLLPLLALYLTKLIIDKIGTALTAPGFPRPTDQFGELLPLLGLAAFVALALELSRGLAGLVSEAQSQLVTDHVRNLLHAKSSEIDLEYYEDTKYYDALHQAQTEATYRPTLILNKLIQGGQSGFSLVALAFLLISLHWIIVLVLFLAVLPGLFLRLKHADKLYFKWQEWSPKERRADYFSWMLTSEEYAKELRLFNLGALFQSRFRHLRHQISRERLALVRRKLWVELVMQASTILAIFFAWGFMTYQTLEGAITIGSLVMYYQAFQRSQGLLQETISSMAILYENSLFLSNFYQFLGLKPKVKEAAYPRPVPKPLQYGIRFEKVSFSYRGSNTSILEEVSFTIKVGEIVALVGANGVGKTTLIKLLCRLYDPTSGRVTLDGTDLRDFEIGELRQQIGVVFQDYAHYNLTLRENIGFGQLEWLDQQQKIEEAAREAGADKVVEKLPYGYDTTLGNQFEDGQELSIGEWQKLAIARAFLRQAQIVVLDEPTSALDAQAEYEVLEQFRQLVKDRTALLISHRLSTVQLADRILVLENGRITENGSHEELLDLKGTYARMFETQARQFLRDNVEKAF